MKVNASVTARRGYAMMLVIVFLLLLLSMLGLTYRQVASAMRLESAWSRQVIRDEGSMEAVAQALAFLEAGSPPTNPYVYDVSVTTSAGPRSYQVTIASEGTNLWSVNSVLVPSGP